MNGDLQQRVRLSAGLWLGGLAVSIGLVLLLRATGVIAASAELWALAGSMIVVTLAVLARARSLAARDAESVRILTAAARDLAAGHFERTVPVDQVRLRELRLLGEAIDALAIRAQRDIADLKRLERVRSEFLGNVSHELRTPIFSVQGYLETLIDGAVDDPVVRDDFLRKAHLNVLRLHGLLTDLIEISRIESGEMKMSFRYFDAVEFFRAILDELQPTAEMAGVTLELRITADDRDHGAYGDRDRLKQAVVNLVENAIKYNRPDGAVTVELEFRESELLVRVRDTGIGIPAEDQARIFERFYRVDKNRSRAVGGSGLGLAIVKHIIEAHRSVVQVASTPGVGSTFSFTLKR
ncbi:MAG TPA: ATP-binding protein [Candidatus Kapabacteria bacterium]|jgi:two-component system phosphate regulon sensor histidine kinase PhoR|nr:ATP-binding protein [Candidatus Kapabacteria bacterium]